MMDGAGVFTRADGLKYEGEFCSNVPMGKGTCTWPDGSSYEGDVYNGIRHGEGKYIYSTNSLSYQGQWFEGMMQGKGTMFYNEEKTSWYKGEWEKNKREGVGDRRYTSGNFYSGEWKNNQRHGEGTMKWLALGQQYEGGWQNGEQHGKGTHVWMVKRSDGSQYSQSNRYKGDFVNGQRHGWGTFYYADGSIYEGQWMNNSKHGQGKFISSDGRVFEGAFVNDQMMKTSLNGNTSLTPVGMSDLLRPDLVLNIDDLLKKIPEEKCDVELQQVKFVLLGYDKELKSIYSFYSRLGHGPTPDNTFQLSRLQLCQLFKDCRIHHHGITLSLIDYFMEGSHGAEIHFPFTTFLYDELLNCLVMVAHQLYSKDMMNEEYHLVACLSKLFTNIILPNAKNVKGFLFRQPSFAVGAMKYAKRCWGVYQAFTDADHPMTCRHFLWMLKDLSLLDDKLTTMGIIQIITDERCNPQNLSSFMDLEMTFLEFFEVLLWCAETKFKQLSKSVKKESLPLERDQTEDKDVEFEDKNGEHEDKNEERKDKNAEREDKNAERKDKNAERKDKNAERKDKNAERKDKKAERKDKKAERKDKNAERKDKNEERKDKNAERKDKNEEHEDKNEEREGKNEERKDKNEEREDKNEERKDKNAEREVKNVKFEDKDVESMCDVSAEDAENEEIQDQIKKEFASAGDGEEDMPVQQQHTESQLHIQTIHQFFNHFFFPAVKHHQEVTRNMKAGGTSHIIRNKMKLFGEKQAWERVNMCKEN